MPYLPRWLTTESPGIHSEKCPPVCAVVDVRGEVDLDKGDDQHGATDLVDPALLTDVRDVCFAAQHGVAGKGEQVQFGLSGSSRRQRRWSPLAWCASGSLPFFVVVVECRRAGLTYWLYGTRSAHRSARCDYTATRLERSYGLHRRARAATSKSS